MCRPQVSYTVGFYNDSNKGNNVAEKLTHHTCKKVNTLAGIKIMHTTKSERIEMHLFNSYSNGSWISPCARKNAPSFFP
jgi:hypothetical protein